MKLTTRDCVYAGELPIILVGQRNVVKNNVTMLWHSKLNKIGLQEFSWKTLQHLYCSSMKPRSFLCFQLAIASDEVSNEGLSVWGLAICSRLQWCVTCSSWGALTTLRCSSLARLCPILLLQCWWAIISHPLACLKFCLMCYFYLTVPWFLEFLSMLDYWTLYFKCC